MENSTAQGEEILQDLNRKIAVLKKAIVKDREEKQKDVEELENLKKRLSISELKLSERDSQIQMASKTKDDTEKELSNIKEQIRKSGNTTNPTNPKKNMPNLEQQNKKLLDEYYFLKQQNVDLKNMITALTQENVEMQKKITAKEEFVKKAKADADQKIAKFLKDLEKKEIEVRDAKNSYGLLLENRERLKATLDRNFVEQKNLGDEWEVLNKELLMKQGNIASLNERLLKLSENEALLSSKLMDYKNELDNVK